MNNVEKLEQLEKALRGPRGTLGTAYRKLGHLKSDIGFPSTGLEDVLRAYALHKKPGVDPDKLANQSLSELRSEHVNPDPFPVDGTPFELAAQLGEGLRLYARDIDSSCEAGAAARTILTLERSVQCFEYAVQKCSTDRVDQQAWLLAHRGAARTTGYWLKRALGAGVADKIFGALPSPELFKIAKRDFDDALKLKSDYGWCRRFLAFLLTLEGSDFEKAGSQLERARADGSGNDSSLERSRAILFLNLAGTSAENKHDRASQSLAAATEAMRLDPEEYVAAYYAAASMSILAQESKDATNRRRKRREALAAIEGATVRSQNAISQAYATLIGLTVLKSHLCHCDDDAVDKPKPKENERERAQATLEEAEECKHYVSLAMNARVDLETRVVFDREFCRLMTLDGVHPQLKEELARFLKHFTGAHPDKVTQPQ
jgi:tetratricopeptide (TPR) repeat protein